MIEPIKIGIVDNHDLFTRGLEMLLSEVDNFEVVLTAGNGRELLKVLEEDTSRPDVILLDLKMPELDGMDTTKILKRNYPEIKVIIISMFNSELVILDVIKSRADGYLNKEADPEELELAINSVMKGEGKYFDERVSGILAENIHLRDSLMTRYRKESEFKDVELKVLELICKEKRNQEIAETLGKSIPTIEAIRKRIMLKTGATNVVGVVKYAIRNGLVELDYN